MPPLIADEHSEAELSHRVGPDCFERANKELGS